MVNLIVEPITPIFACCDALLTAEDIASASRFQRESRRVEHLSWRRIVRRELGRDVDIRYNDVGAPEVDTPNIYISVSHSRDVVVVAISDAAVGVDVERSDRNFEGVRSRIMDAYEQSLSDDALWTAMAWCAKEAAYKLYGRRGIDLLEGIKLKSYNRDIQQVGVSIEGVAVAVDFDFSHSGYIVATAVYCN
jgi:phosphopantetheinyl transferase